MAVPDTPFQEITDDKIFAQSPWIEEIPFFDRDNLQRLYEIVLGNGVDPGDPAIQAGPLPTGGGLPAAVFAIPVSHTITVSGSLGVFGPWIPRFERSGIWTPSGIQGIHIKGDLSNSISTESFVQYRMVIDGPGGEDIGNIIQTTDGTGIKIGEILSVLLSNDNMNAEVTHRIESRQFLQGAFAIGNSDFDPTSTDYELYHHFGQIA